jgi:hypothetical protein
LSFRPQTADAQASAVAAALKENEDLQRSLSKQIREIQDLSSVSAPFDAKIKADTAKYSSFEDDILRRCVNIVDTTTDPDYTRSDDDMGPPLPGDLNFPVQGANRIGEYRLSIPGGKTILFSSPQSAAECREQFVQHRDDEVTPHIRRIQDFMSEKNKIISARLEDKKPSVAPLNQKQQELYFDNQRLRGLLQQVQMRAVEEKVLGAPLTTEKRTVSEKTDGNTDWARVIETNATRIGALGAMFFLVTILVPQYRYNIRMASFYEARGDGIELLPNSAEVEDLKKIFETMTPNIDFGKAPPTPWEQIIEVIKTARS